MGKFKMSLIEKRKYLQKKRKYQQEKRKIRKKKLIQLGTLFAICNLLEETQETILGFLYDFKIEDKYTIQGEYILKNKPLVNFPNDYVERKKYFYKIIRKSALLEKLNLHLNNPKTILGYLATFKELDDITLKKYETIGKQLFKKNVSDEEKIELVKLFIKKKLSIKNYLEELKLSLDNIDYNTYLKIKKELDF